MKFAARAAREAQFLQLGSAALEHLRVGLDDLLDQPISREGLQGLGHYFSHRVNLGPEPRWRRRGTGEHTIDQTLDGDPLLRLRADRAVALEARAREEDDGIAPVAIFARLLGPTLLCGVVSLKPWVASVGDAGRATDENAAAGRDDAVQHGTGAFGIHPMERASDRHDVERPDGRWQGFRPSVDQAQGHPRALGRLTRGLKHRRLRIDADHLADEGSETEREQPRPSAEIEEPFTPAEAERPRHLGEEGFP